MVLQMAFGCEASLENVSAVRSIEVVMPVSELVLVVDRLRRELDVALGLESASAVGGR